MRFFRILQQKLRRSDPSWLGEITAPRTVEVDGVVIAPRDLVSPASGLRLSYFHIELGEAVRFVDDDAVFEPSLSRADFFPFAELKSDADLVVRTRDDREVTLPSGYFLVRSASRSGRAARLKRAPDALRPIVGSTFAARSSARRPDASRILSYREIVLVPGDRVRFAGTIEPIVAGATGDYRSAPRVSYRMRPEREPIIVEEAA